MRHRLHDIHPSASVAAMRCSLWIVVLVVGCGKNEATTNGESAAKAIESAPPSAPKSKPARKPSGTPRRQTKLTVTRDGQPVAIEQALAWLDTNGTLKFTASSVAVGCDEVTGTMRRHYDGEVTFDVSVGSVLQPDGSRRGMIKQTYFEGMTNQRDAETVVSGGGAPGQSSTVEVDFTSTGVGKDKHALVVKGTIDALGCEVTATKQTPPALPPEMPATLEIAGKKLAIRGARLTKVGDWPQLSLTTGGEACKPAAGAVEGELRVELTWMKKDDPVPGQITLGGSIMKPVMDQRFDRKKLSIKPAPPVAGEVEIKGDIVAGGYPVKLDGKVTVVECPK